MNEAQIRKEAKLELLAKIANTEGWEETAWVYCTEPEIAMSPTDFEKYRRTVLSQLDEAEDRGDVIYANR